MKRLEGRTAVVTGAGSGIGRAVSLALAGAGCHLALADRNEQALAETAERAMREGRRVSRHVIDVSDRERMQALADDVLSSHGGVEILVNNAGVTAISSFEDQKLEDFAWLMGINFWGVVYGCKFFLPALRRAEEAHIVNVSSVFGILGVPMQSSYCASKFAVRGFSESLRAELADTGVGVTSVHPGGIATNIVKDGRYDGHGADALRNELVTTFASRMLSPERAAEIIVSAVRRNAPRALITREAHLIDFVQRVAPSLGAFLTARAYRQTRKRLAGA